VAVVQISKIQVRRGQKNQGSGLPQLASGEIGWAIDTREMYIGNGAVSEGAPAVGNTKILTEYDDILNLANAYTYKVNDSYIVTGVNSSNPITRTLQERLDDRLSVKSFGAVGNNSTDDTAALQRAIFQCYLNSATKGSAHSRIKLHLEAGTYLISDTIYIPPYTTLIGAGADKTIIKQTNAGSPIFRTVDSNHTIGEAPDDSGTTTLTQAKNIRMEGMTLELTDVGVNVQLKNCKDSTFEDLYFKGEWDPVVNPVDASYLALGLDSNNNTVESKNNKFINCHFSHHAYAVLSNWDIDQNIWDNCTFNNLGYGVVFGPESRTYEDPANPGNFLNAEGPSYNKILNSNFTDIHRQAISIIRGKYNSSENNRFISCGNNGGTELTPVYSVIRYDNSTNKSVNDYFTRTKSLSYGAGLDNIPYIPEIEGTAMYDLDFENTVAFGQSNNVRLFRLPGVINQSYEVDYIMVSETYELIRSGKLHVVVDAYGNTVEISDEYHFNGDESYLESVSFAAILRNANGDADDETIDINVTSTMPVDDDTRFKYTVHAKKTNII